VQASYCDFLRVGSATQNALTATFGGDTEGCSFDHCTFTSTGPWNIANPGNGTPMSFTDCTFSSSLQTTCLTWLTNQAATAVRTLARNYFDQSVGGFATASGVSCEDCVFENYQSMDPGLGVWNYFRNCLERLTAAGGGQITGDIPGGDETNVYVLADNQNGNPHVYGVQANGVFDGMIVEYTGPFLTDGGDFVIYQTALDITIKNSIFLKAQADGNIGTNVFNSQIGPSKAYYNTIFTGGQGGCATGEFGTSAHTYTGYKSNVCYMESYSGTYGQHVYCSLHTGSPNSELKDVVDGETCLNNVAWNLWPAYAYTTDHPGIAGVGYDTYTTNAPGVNDLRLANGGQGPGFVDTSRNFGQWAVSRGSTAGTYAGKVADGLSFLKADPTLVRTSLLPWVRAGFAPTKNVLKMVGHDGKSYVGAVPYSPPTSRRHGYRRNLARGA
jgi:hypothetical protein